MNTTTYVQGDDGRNLDAKVDPSADIELGRVVEVRNDAPRRKDAPAVTVTGVI